MRLEYLGCQSHWRSTATASAFQREGRFSMGDRVIGVCVGIALFGLRARVDDT